MRVLFVLEHYYPYIGGAETLFQLLAEALAQRGHDITVVTTRFKPTLPQEEIIAGVKVVRVDCRNRFLFTFLSLPAIWRHAVDVDFIHTTTYNAAPPAWLVGKLRRKKLVLTFHELWGKLWFRLPFISRIAAFIYYAYEQLVRHLPFDHYVAVSQFTQSALMKAGVKSQKINQIYNGLDYADFADYQHQPPAKFVATYFGRLGISKGLNLLIPAFAKFGNKHPEVRLQLIIPKQPKGMFRQVNQLIEKSGAKPFVDLLHELPKEKLRQTICQSSCVLIPSYSEGFCFVAAETVAMQVPIISSGQGALKETVSGTYLEMDNMSVSALANCLEKAYQNDWEIKSPQQFSLASSVEQYLAAYEDWRGE